MSTRESTKKNFNQKEEKLSSLKRDHLEKVHIFHNNSFSSSGRLHYACMTKVTTAVSKLIHSYNKDIKTDPVQSLIKFQARNYIS